MRRNLPSPLAHESLISNDTNNNSSSKPGILKNRQNDLSRRLAEPESDFEFRRLSESLKQEIKAGRSLKSVSFSTTLVAEDLLGKFNKNDESEQIDNRIKQREPNIDKYGRIDGYSERRLFMGKGARLRELKYIQESRQQDSIPESRTATFPEDKSHFVQTTHRDHDLVAMQPLQEASKLEEKITTATEPTTLTENPEAKTSMTVIEIPEVQNPEEPRTEVESPGVEKTEQPTTGVDQLQERLETLMSEVENRESAVPEQPSIAVEIGEADNPDEQINDNAVENREPPHPEPAIVTEIETHPIIETLVIMPSVQEVRVLEEEPMTPVEVPEPQDPEKQKQPMIESHSGEPLLNISNKCRDIRYLKAEPTSVVEKPEHHRPDEFKNGTGNQSRKSKDPKDFDQDKNSIKKPNKPKIEYFSSRNGIESSISLPPKTRALKATETRVKSIDTKPCTTRESPEGKYEIVINNRKVEMVSCSTQTDDGYKPGNETRFRDSQKKISNETVTRALVPTRVWDDTVEDDSKIDFESIDSIDLTPEPQFGSAAWHNLQLIGASFGDTSYEETIPQYSHYQNNFVTNSATFNNLPIPYQAFNNGVQTPQISNYSPTGYGYLLVSLSNGFSNQDLTNPSYPNNIVYKPSERIEDQNYSAFQLKSDYERRFQNAVTAPPGFVKSLQLPPGFARNEKEPDNCDIGSDSTESVQSTKYEVQREKAAPSRPGTKCRNRRKKVEQNQTRDVRGSETGSEYRKRVKNLRQRARYYWRKYEFEVRNSCHDHPQSTSQRDATNEKSATWIEKISKAQRSDNHYLTESIDSPVDHRASNNSSHSEMPLDYQTPNQHQPGIDVAANWHTSPMPLNSGYQYMPPIQNSHTLASGSYNPMTYQPQLMSPIKTAHETNTSYNVGTVPKAPKGRGRGRAHQK